MRRYLRRSGGPPGRARSLGRKALAVGAASTLGVLAYAVPAAADLDNYPDEPAESAASVVDSSILGQDLAGGALSDAGSVTNPGPNQEALNADLLGGQLIQLGDISLPLDDFIDFGQMGALLSESEASGPLDARAISGLAGGDGSITLDGENADFGAAEIDLLSLFTELGVDGVTDLLVDEATLLLGAGGAEVVAENGEFLDPDGVGGDGQYRVGEATLLAHSPVVAEAAGQIYDIAGEVDRTTEELINEQLDLSPVFALLPGTDVSVTIESDMQDELVADIFAEPITSNNEVVTIDFSTGTVQIHLDKIISGGLDPEKPAGLNNQDPNTELISVDTYPLIAETIHDVIHEVINIMVGAIEGALDSVTLNFRAEQDLGLGNVAIATWSVSLNGDVTPVDCSESTGVLGQTTCQTLAAVIDGASGVFEALVAPIRDFILSDAGDNLYELLITDLKTGAVTIPIREALRPFVDLLAQVVSLQLNRQVTETCTTDDGAELLGSLEVSALSLGLVQAADGGRLNFGNAGARVDACEAAAAELTLTADPDAVVPGGSTEVTGDGYTPDSTVTVELLDPEGEVVATVPAETDETGSFVVDLVVPEDAVPGEDYVVRGTDDDTDEFAEVPFEVLDPAVACADPAVTVDPSAVEPGDVVTVTGTGFVPGPGTVQVVSADGTELFDPALEVTVDDGCGFETEVTIPEDAEPGDYDVIGEDEDGNTGSAPLEVLEPGAGGLTLTVNPDAVVPGGTTEVTGEGYTPESTATVELLDPEGDVAATVPAETDDAGTFVVDLVVPDDAVPSDEYVVEGTDDDTGESADVPFEVLDPAVACADPAVTVSPTSVPAGETVTVTGTGFAPGPATVQVVSADGTELFDPALEVTVDDGCGFETEVTIPEDAEPGDYDVVAEDEDGNTDSAPLEVLEPGAGGLTLTVNPDAVEAGGTTEVTGEGYTPESSATVELLDPDGGVAATVPAETDDDGTFVVDLVVPEDAAPSDAYVVEGTDDDTGESAEAPLEVLEPGAGGLTLTVDPDAVVPGGTTEVTGDGYTPESTATVELVNPDGDVVATVPAETDDDGGFAVALVVPEDAAPGEGYVVEGTDDDTGESAEAPLEVLDPAVACADPVITLDPTSVEPGGVVTVTGTGFAPGPGTVQVVSADGTELFDPALEITVDDGCGFETEVTIPDDAEAGEYEVIAEDEDGNSGTAPLTIVDPAAGGLTLSVDPSAVVPGGTTAVSGEGYTPESPVTIELVDPDGDVVATIPAEAGAEPVLAEADGTFVVDLVVPDDAVPAAGYSVRGIDDATERVAEAALEVLDPAVACSDPTITLDPESVFPGEEVTVTGTGFPAGIDVVVDVLDADGQSVLADPITVTVGDDCGFTVVLTVFEDAEPGEYEVVAEPVDGSEGDSATLTVKEPAGDDDGNGGGGDDQGNEDGDDDGGSLPDTGADLVVLGALTLLLLTGGAVLMRTRRGQEIG